MPIPLLALGIIKDDDKISLGHQFQAFDDGFPRGEEVTQRDGHKVVHQGRAQQGRTRGQGRDSGDDFQVEIHVRLAFGRSHFKPLGGAHLQDQSGHTINTGITAGNQGHPLPGAGLVQGQLTALHFGLHPRGHHFLVIQQGTYQFDISLVAHYYLGLGQGSLGPGNDIIGKTWPQANNH